MSYGKTPDQIVGFYQEAIRRITELPGVDARRRGHGRPVARRGSFGFGFAVLGRRPCPRAGRRRSARAVPHRDLARVFCDARASRSSPDAISTMPIAASSEPVVIVSQSVAQRMFPNQDAVNRHVMWTDPVMKFIDLSARPAASSAWRPIWTTKMWCPARR